MAEIRKLAAILCSDVVGYSRLAGADEDRILARLRALRSDLIDPTIAVHNGRIVKRTGDEAIVEFRSVVDAVRAPRKYQALAAGTAESGAHLWAQEFDHDRAELLATEDDIVTRLARTLQIQLTDIEAANLQRSHPAGNPDVQELTLRCTSRAWLAAALAFAGHNDEAREALKEYLAAPDARPKTIAAFKKNINSDNPSYLATRERIYEGLRKAGMPEE